MKNKNGKFNFPWYVWVSAIFVLAWTGLVYLIGYLVAKFNLVPYHFTSYIPAIDDHIPLFPYVFWLIYILAFAFWFITPLLLWKIDKKNYINFLFAIFISQFISLIIYVSCPVIMDRSADGTWQKIQEGWGLPYILMRWVWQLRGTHIISYCKLPSGHTLLSFLCAIYIFTCNKVDKKLKWGSLIYAILVMASTVLNKSHYFLDLVVGLGLGVLVWSILIPINPSKKLLPILEKKLNKKKLK